MTGRTIKITETQSGKGFRYECMERTGHPRRLVEVEIKGDNYARVTHDSKHDAPGFITEHGDCMIGVSEPVAGRWDNTHGLIVDGLFRD